MPRPVEPIAAARRSISRSVPSRLGTGRPRSPTWFEFVVDEKPMAPSAIASFTSAAMRSSSSSVASRSHAASPMTNCRTAECPMSGATFTHSGSRSSASRYSRKVSNSHWMPFCIASSDMPSTYSSIFIRVRRSSGRHGARVKPQLPVTMVVTPCHDVHDALGSQVSWAS